MKAITNILNKLTMKQTKETSISKDSLEDRKIVAETTEYIDFANAFNDVPHTSILAGYAESKFEDVKLCLVLGRNRDQVKERMNLICEAVNNYNALKEINKELVEALERITELEYKNHIVSVAKLALQKAKQL